jgi:hypothetical protein
MPGFSGRQWFFGGLNGGRLVSPDLDAGVASYGPMIRVLYAIDAVGFVISLTAVCLERRAGAPVRSGS